MDYPFQITGYENLNLAVRSGGIFGGIKIVQNGQVIKRVKGKYPVQTADGKEILIGFKRGLDIFRPKIAYEDQVIAVFPPLPIYVLIIAYLPLILVITGGALGGLAGGIGAAVNFSILESKMPMSFKIIANLLVLPVSIAVYLLLVFLLLTSVKK